MRAQGLQRDLQAARTKRLTAARENPTRVSRRRAYHCHVSYHRSISYAELQRRIKADAK